MCPTRCVPAHRPRVAEAGLALLERMRAGLLERMARVKEEVGKLVDGAQESLCADSAHTLECQRRAAIAGELIGKLGIKSRDEGHTRPSTLFSGEEEEHAEESEAVEATAE